MLGGMERFAVVPGGKVELGGDVEIAAFLLDALLLRLAEFGQVLFALAIETRFLQLQIAKLLFVKEKRFELDETRPEREFLVAEFFGELDPAFGIDGELEGRDAVETPIDIG